MKKLNNIFIISLFCFLATSSYSQETTPTTTNPSTGEECPACDTSIPSNVLTDPMYEKYRNEVKRTESGNDYSAVNQFGYMGAYQMGKAALIDAGYVVNDGNLSNKSEYVWTEKAKKEGVTTKEGFLANQKLQDEAFDTYTKMQAEGIVRVSNGNNAKYSGALDLLCSEVSAGSRSGGVDFWGILKGSHLLGVGGAVEAFKSGTTSTSVDGNGHSVANYMLDGASLKNDCIPTGSEHPCSQGEPTASG